MEYDQSEFNCEENMNLEANNMDVDENNLVLDQNYVNLDHIAMDLDQNNIDVEVNDEERNFAELNHIFENNLFDNVSNGSVDTDVDEDDNPFLDINRIDLILPLIPKDNMTSMDHFLAILAIGVRYKLNYETIVSILKWTALTLEYTDLPSTKKALWTVLGINDSHLIRHMYCKLCDSFLGKEEDLRDCKCGKCGPGKDKSNLAYFIQLKLEPQLKELLKNEEIRKHLNYRFERQKENPEAIEDLLDGHEYEKLCEPGEFLSYRYNYSLTFKFPPFLRKKYMLLAGVWVDKKHPYMKEFCKPFTDELQHLYQRGMKWKLDNQEITSRFIAIICSVDSKARPDVLNMTHCNGENGCTFCYHVGQSVENNSLHRIYPYYGNEDLRTDAEIRSDMLLGYGGARVNGVKGPSFLAAFPEYDLGKGTVVESMHNVFLGISRHITKLVLFSSRENDFNFGSPENLAVVNERLLEIKPPSCISRKPRDISTYSDWKASEWRNWLLLYLLPCLEGILPNRIFNLFAKLCEAIYLLNQSSITLQDLGLSRMKLLEFHEEFQDIFGLINMTFNHHLLTHLADTVFNWGPIWAHSAFPFEACNYDITRSVTSSNGRALQIVTRFLLAKFVELSMDSDLITVDTQRFIKNLFKRYPDTHRTDEFINIGLFRRINLNELGLNVLHEAQYYNMNNVIEYEKVMIKGSEYRRCDVSEDTKFCNAYLCFDKSQFGKIISIMSFNDQGRNVK